MRDFQHGRHHTGTPMLECASFSAVDTVVGRVTHKHLAASHGRRQLGRDYARWTHMTVGSHVNTVVSELHCHLTKHTSYAMVKGMMVITTLLNPIEMRQGYPMYRLCFQTSTDTPILPLF